MLGFKQMIKNLFGKDIKDMTDEEFEKKIEEIKKLTPTPKPLSYDELLLIPKEKWRDYDVEMVKIIQAKGIVPCSLCQKLIGKYIKTIDAEFYFNNAKQNHKEPFCLDYVPAFKIKGSSRCELPEFSEKHFENLPEYQFFHKWSEDIYNRDHIDKPEDDIEKITGAFDFEPHLLNKDTAENGGYDKYNPYGLLSCIFKTVSSNSDENDLSWLIPLLNRIKDSNISSYKKARSEKLRGELLLKQSNKNEALLAFNEAIKLDGNIGLKRKIASIEKELSMGKMDNPEVSR